MGTSEQLSLETVAAEINREHEAFREAARSAVEHARRAGERLLEAKAQIGHGKWLPWVREHLSFSEHTAQTYMRVARRLEALPDGEAQRVAGLPLREALAELAESHAAPERPEERRMTDLGLLPISEIEVRTRRRLRLGDLSRLMASIEKVGLLHPIVVDDRMVLVCGWRRLVACEALGRTEIDAVSLGPVTDEERWELEEAENKWANYDAEELAKDMSKPADPGAARA